MNQETIAEQKRIAVLIALQALCGLIAGLLASAIMASIASPNHEDILMTQRMAADFRDLAFIYRCLGFFGGLDWPLLTAAFLLSWVLTARWINPRLQGFPFAALPRPLLAWTAVIVSGGAFWMGLTAAGGQDFLNGGGVKPLALLGSAGGGAVCWLILSPWGWAGELDSWLPRSGTRRWLKAALVGAGFGACAGFFFQSAEKVFQFLFQWVLEVGFPSPEVNPRQGLIVFSLPPAIAAFTFAAGFGLAPTWSPEALSFPARLRRALLPAAVIALGAVWVLGLHGRAVRENQWRAGTLFQAAGLPDAEAPVWTLVALGADGRREPTLQPWRLELRSAQAIPATEANIRALERFLAQGEKHSRFRREAMEARLHASRVLWDREEALATASALGDRLLEPNLELAWLMRSAPVTSANRARLAALSDPGRYQARGRSAWNLAKAWHRFGDRDRALPWLAMARISYAPQDEELALPAESPFSGGSAQGRLYLDGKPLAGARVGIFALTDKTDALTLPTAGHISANLADVRVLGADGGFRFSGLSEGRYALCALLPPGTLSPKDGPKAASLPGIFTLSRGAGRAELGRIALNR